MSLKKLKKCIEIKTKLCTLRLHTRVAENIYYRLRFRAFLLQLEKE